MAFWYSVRLRRRNVSVRPGLGRAAAAASSDDSSQAIGRLEFLFGGLRHLCRRHLSGGKLANYFFPDLLILAEVRGDDLVERQVRRLGGAVVAIEAVRFDKLLQFSLARSQAELAAR